VYLEDYGWSHGRHWAFAGPYKVLWRRREIPRWLRSRDGEIVHLVVEHYPSGRRQHQSAKRVVHSGGHGNSIPMRVHNAEVARPVILQLTPPNLHIMLGQISIHLSTFNEFEKMPTYLPP
jgi:hypothetical protein